LSECTHPEAIKADQLREAAEISEITDNAEEVEPTGHFRIYLGAAPGVGKTYAMLSEAQRRKGRGADIVVGFVESYGRPLTEALIDGLEIIPRKTVDYRGARLEEMDLDAVLRRRPEIALVDELAHTNVPRSGRNVKRWQDVLDILLLPRPPTPVRSRNPDRVRYHPERCACLGFCGRLRRPRDS
jgi:two-component system, OmpR family, sensor histidine kinase KdpD